MIQHVVDQIHNDPWQRLYRRKPVGPQVQSWPSRLMQYSWASRDQPDLAGHLIWLQTVSVEAAKYPASPVGEQIASDVLKWGGVTRGNVAKISTVLGNVVSSARTGAAVASAPMNSGWTKIAAVFSYSTIAAPPQVIWDSRVSLSVCTRLGTAAVARGLQRNQVRSLFPGLGWVGGRGGNRPDLMKAASVWFSNRYGSWAAHFAGGKIAKDMADILNSNPRKYGQIGDAFRLEDKAMLESNGIQIPNLWTPWLVACVLFMDGQ